MTRRRLLKLILGAGAILLLVAPLVLAGPRARTVAIGIALVVGGAVALLVLGERTRAAFGLTMPSELELALRDEREPASRVPELEKLEREVYLGSARAFDLHYRLRPILREIAETRLATRGIGAAGAPSALGEELWEIVRPDREPPRRRHAPGIPVEELERAVVRLENL
jgi:hypothetical protein